MPMKTWAVITAVLSKFFIVYGSLMIKNGTLRIRYDITTPDRCQGTKHTIANYHGISRDGCVMECAMRRHCKALNYHSAMLFCELFTKVAEPYTKNKCTHIERKHIKVLKSPCVKACKVGSTCDWETKSCKIKECMDFPEIANGKVIGNRKEVGRKMSVRCYRGYEHKDDIKQAFCTDEGVWNPQIECMLVGCKQLDTPENVSVASSNGTQTHSVTIYSCENDYVGTQETWTRRCEENGFWSGAEPKCTRIDCGQLVYPENATVLSNNGTHIWSVYELACKPGFEGSQETWTFKCEGNGNWSRQEVTCAPVVCEDLEAPESATLETNDGNTFLSTRTYSCLTEDGERTWARECQSDKTWGGTDPICITLKCEVLVTPPQALLDLDEGLEIGAVKHYTCETGFDGFQNESTRVCQENLTWSGTELRCLKSICKKKYPLENDTFVIAFTNGTAERSIIKYECKTDFVDVRYTLLHICQANGKWNTTTPDCRPKVCTVTKCYALYEKIYTWLPPVHRLYKATRDECFEICETYPELDFIMHMPVFENRNQCHCFAMEEVPYKDFTMVEEYNIYYFYENII